MNLQNINVILGKESNRSQLSEFLNSCANEKCGYPGPSFQQFLNMGWTEAEFNYIHKVILSYFSNPLVLSLDESKMPPEFLDFPDTLKAEILNCIRVRQGPLVNALLIESSQRSLPTMIDFDWRLRMVMGSSKVATLREPLLQIDLKVKEKDKEHIIAVEMNKNELDNFIKVLESVKK